MFGISPMRQSPFQCAGRLLLSLGGIGFLPRLSPTIATAVSALLLWLVSIALPADPQQRLALLLALFIGIAAAAFIALARCVPAQHYDQRYVVIDEFLGMFVALFPSLLAGVPAAALLLAAFGIFRVIDHTKPLFIRSIDKCNTPASVLLDDIIAGVYTAFVLAVMLEFLPLAALHAAPLVAM